MNEWKRRNNPVVEDQLKTPKLFLLKRIVDVEGNRTKKFDSIDIYTYNDTVDTNQIYLIFKAL
jgi:hypothetical protein